jgi:hypothetical protein
MRWYKTSEKVYHTGINYKPQLLKVKIMCDANQLAGAITVSKYLEIPCAALCPVCPAEQKDTEFEDGAESIKVRRSNLE